MPTQSHHLIPQNLISNHPLFKAMRASGVQHTGFQLDLPDKNSAAAAAAASMAGDIADTAHQGRHLAAYDRLVSAYLTEFQLEYVEDLGGENFRLLPGTDIDALLNDLRSLDVRLADWHTASIDADGKVTSPQAILNRSDPRIVNGSVTPDQAIARMDELAVIPD